MSAIKTFVNKRKFIRKSVTENHNSRSQFASFSAAEKLSKKYAFDSWLAELKDLDDKILNIRYGEWDEDSLESNTELELKLSLTYERKIHDCLSLLQSPQPPRSNISDVARSLLKSPTAPLPKFSSKEDEDLLRFFEQFEETIGQFNYVDYDKLTLLKQQLSGRALILIDSLDADNRNYAGAKALLIEAFASTDKQIFSLIKQISELKLGANTDPFEYVSKMKQLTERVKKLQLDEDSFLRYFFWEGLNETFQRELIQITNHTKPSLQEINENFFEATERYLTFQNSQKEKRNVSRNFTKETAVGMAANVNVSKKDNRFKPCSICSKFENCDASHPIFRCDKYDSPSAKVEKLKSFGACLKCSGINHNSDTCKYRFHQRCKHCSGWHFSFLCLKGMNSQSINKKKNKEDRDDAKTGAVKKEVSSSLCITEALQTDLNGSSILPTFSVVINDTHTVRGLKDGGCQSNFILDSLAKKLNLNILQDHVSLTVNGINAPMTYHTRLVEMKIRLGDKEYVVTAFCLPSINICLNLPYLSEVATEVSRKGYKLADSCLIDCNDKLTNIEFILGTKHGYCLPESEIVFGQHSLLSITPAGVLLKGDTEELLNDLPLLPLGGKVSTCLSASEILSIINPKSFQASPYDEINVETTCEVSVNLSVIDENGCVIDSELERATQQTLESQCSYYTNLDTGTGDDASAEINDKLVKFAFDSMTRKEDGRLCVPLLWNSNVSHLLGKNRHLSEAILKSNLRKLQRNHSHLELMDNVFKEQEELGIIERIDNFEEFLEQHPEHSFLPHMGVFKLDRETTKCRVVYLSNLCERDPTLKMTVSHNQAIHSGPSLNQKLSSSLLHLRFGSKLLCFDLKKAFNTLSLSEVDSNRLLCLWFKNIKKGDFSTVVYRNIRLSFGLRCSPALLLLALFKILILDVEQDTPRLRDLKKLIYSLTYMDNCAVTCDSSTELSWAHEQLQNIFEPYKFGLQQFLTNDIALQEKIDRAEEKVTPSEVKLLGINWDRASDTLYTKPLKLNAHANTKRAILSTIASQFDIYGFNGPILNRARFFLHELQMDKELGWDQILDESRLKNWKNIANQVNSSVAIKIKRFVGSRNHSYNLIACADSSKQAYGVVVYIHNVDTNEVDFVLSKNRLIGKDLSSKSIPSLELRGVSFAAECLIDLYKELTGPSCLLPIKVKELLVFTDSLVTMSWIQAFSQKMDKMQKRSPFILNRLEEIQRFCETFPITFSFIAGTENPGDCVTRSLSSRQLLKTNYLSGPDFLTKPNLMKNSMSEIVSVKIPNPLTVIDNTDISCSDSIHCHLAVSDHSDLLVECSDFHKVIRTYRKMIYVVDRWKKFLISRQPSRNLLTKPKDHNFYQEACYLAVRKEQELQYPDVFKYFRSPNKLTKSIPNIVSQLNVFMDTNGLLRVRSKLGRLQNNSRYKFPLLLAKKSPFTNMVISEYHQRFSHAGCYTLLSELRKYFWIPHYFSTVKRTIKNCITCRRFNERSIKLNQNDYRMFRVDPPAVPFRTIFVDYIGPFFVKQSGSKVKVWLLCITCTWSRAINLKICMDLTVHEFLRSFQLHCYEYGVPEYCVSDLGSQIVAGSNRIMDYLKDSEAKTYFHEQGIQPIHFDQFYKGCSQLGSMVEICVKLTKKLLFGAIKNNVLTYRDFEFLICKTIHIVNRRPVAFKEALRDSSLDVPDAITPELLVRGYTLPSINLIPELQGVPDHTDPDWTINDHPSDNVKNKFEKLQKVRNNLIELYHSEFLNTLISQAVNTKDRYKPVKHKVLKVGDIVLIKEIHCKPSQYPMGRVKEVIRNSLGEVTGAMVLKGKNREVIKRHSSSLIFLLSPEGELELDGSMVQCEDHAEEAISTKSERPKRRAAVKGREKLKNCLQQQDIH